MKQSLDIVTNNSVTNRIENYNDDKLATKTESEKWKKEDEIETSKTQRENFRKSILLKSHCICYKYQRPVTYCTATSCSYNSSVNEINSPQNEQNNEIIHVQPKSSLVEKIQKPYKLQTDVLEVYAATNTESKGKFSDSSPESNRSINRGTCRCTRRFFPSDTISSTTRSNNTEETSNQTSSMSSAPYESTGRRRKNGRDQSESRSMTVTESERSCYKFDCFGCYKKPLKNCSPLTSKGTGGYYPQQTIKRTKRSSVRSSTTHCRCTHDKKPVRYAATKNNNRKEFPKQESEVSFRLPPEEEKRINKKSPEKHCHCTHYLAENEKVTKIYQLEEPKETRKDNHCHCSSKMHEKNVNAYERRQRNVQDVYNYHIINSVTFGKKYNYKSNDSDNCIASSNNCESCLSYKDKLKENSTLNPLWIKFNYFNNSNKYLSKIDKFNTIESLYQSIKPTDTELQKMYNNIEYDENSCSLRKNLSDGNGYMSDEISSKSGYNSKTSTEISPQTKRNKLTIVTNPIIHSQKIKLSNETKEFDKKFEEEPKEIINKQDKMMMSLTTECSDTLDKNFKSETDGSCGDFINDANEVINTTETDVENIMTCKEIVKEILRSYNVKEKTANPPKVDSSHDQQVINPCGNIIFVVVEEPSCKMGCCYRVYKQCTTHGTTIPANKFTSIHNTDPLPSPIYPISKGSSKFTCQLRTELNNMNFENNEGSKRTEVFYMTKDAQHSSKVLRPAVSSLEKNDSEREDYKK